MAQIWREQRNSNAAAVKMFCLKTLLWKTNEGQKAFYFLAGVEHKEHFMLVQLSFH